MEKLTKEEQEKAEKEMMYILKEYFQSNSINDLTMSLAENLMAGIGKAKEMVGETIGLEVGKKESPENATNIIARAEIVYRTCLIRALAMCISTIHYSTFSRSVFNTPETVKSFIELILGAYIATNNLGDSITTDAVLIPMPNPHSGPSKNFN